MRGGSVTGAAVGAGTAVVASMMVVFTVVSLGSNSTGPSDWVVDDSWAVVEPSPSRPWSVSGSRELDVDGPSSTIATSEPSSPRFMSSTTITTAPINTMAALIATTTFNQLLFGGPGCDPSPVDDANADAVGMAVGASGPDPATPPACGLHGLLPGCWVIGGNLDRLGIVGPRNTTDVMRCSTITCFALSSRLSRNVHTMYWPAGSPRRIVVTPAVMLSLVLVAGSCSDPGASTAEPAGSATSALSLIHISEPTRPY